MKSPMQTTNTMAIKSDMLDKADLEGIVRLCVNFGVSRLKYRGLEVEFRMPEISEGVPDSGLETYETPVKEITDEQHKAQTALSISEEELFLREQQIADLQLTDPLAAEEMILNGELDDAGDGDESTE
jgi:hypothetical protein